VFGLDDATACQAMSIVLGSDCDLSAAAHLPAQAAARIAVTAASGRAVTALRLEGVEPSVSHRHRLVNTMFAARSLTALEAPASRAFWRAVRDVTAFAADGPAGDRAVWRVSTAPRQGHALAAAVTATADAEVIYDWAGGLIWLAVPPGADANADVVRAAVRASGGHATLIRAPLPLRASIEVFEPQDAGVAALSRRIKDSFDPNRVLNPGRMWAGV
jgi:glycolate oxidase FAD binding subunit